MNIQNTEAVHESMDKAVDEYSEAVHESVDKAVDEYSEAVHESMDKAVDEYSEHRSCARVNGQGGG